MSDGNVDAAFDAIEYLMMTAAVTRASREGPEYAKRFQEFLTHYIEPVFQELSEIIASGKLSHKANEWKPAWKEMNPEYQNKKKAEGFPSPGYALRTGMANESIRGLRGSNVFGRPVVQGTAVVAGVVSTFTVDKNNKLRFAKGTRMMIDGRDRGIGGRFAKLAEFQNLKVTISFQPGKGEDYVGAQIGRAWLEDTVSRQFAAFELGTARRKRGGKQYARPLLIPWLRWKLGAGLDAAVSKYVSSPGLVR